MSGPPAKPIPGTPGLAAGGATLVLFVAWACRDAGYWPSQWAPGGLMVLGLICVCAILHRVRSVDVAPPVKLSLGCLAAYTALSFLSALWAQAPSAALEGANRTLFYLLVFALFAIWVSSATQAAVLLGGWSLAISGVAAYALLRLDAAPASMLHDLIPEGRLSFPSGYTNANAAQWLMAFWPAVLLARSYRVPWQIRGLLAGGAVLLADTALLSQSRGSLYATVTTLALVFVLLGDRVRTFAHVLPITAGIAASAPFVLAVGDRLAAGVVSSAHVQDATVASFVAALAVGLLVAAGAAAETSASVSSTLARRVRRGFGVVALATLLAGTAAALVAVGNPITRVQRTWRDFKRGYAADASGTDRLVSGVGSERYDFYRVALDEFSAHPLLGIGADNFREQYLRRRRSSVAPRYPHSLELATLTETGLVGGLLGLVGLGSALLAGGAAARSRSDPLASAVAAAALSGFAYWLIHGSVDWFWEIAGLGAPAFALLGLACALASATPATRHGATARRPGARRRGAMTQHIPDLPPRGAAVTGAALALAGVASFTAQWIR
jgi:hypothetical protein